MGGGPSPLPLPPSSWRKRAPACAAGGLLFRHIWLDPETVCYLDNDSDRACSVGPNPTPGSVGAVTTAPTVYVVTTVDTVTTVSAVTTHVPISTSLNTSCDGNYAGSCWGAKYTTGP